MASTDQPAIPEANLRARRTTASTDTPTPEDLSKTKRAWSLSRTEWFSLAFSITVALAATLFILWALDFLSTGSWEDKHDTRATFVLGDSNGDLRVDLTVPRVDMPPTVVAFYSETCPYCKRMRIPFMKTANEFLDVRFLGLRISKEDEENRKLAKGFGLTHIPTLYFVTVEREGGELSFRREKYEGSAREGAIAQFVRQQLKKVV